MDWGCIYLQVYGNGNFVTCQRIRLTTLRWGDMYYTEGWCRPSGFPARDDDLSVLVRRGKMSTWERFSTNKHSVLNSLTLYSVHSHCSPTQSRNTYHPNKPEHSTAAHTLSHRITHIQHKCVLVIKWQVHNLSSVASNALTFKPIEKLNF